MSEPIRLRAEFTANRIIINTSTVNGLALRLVADTGGAMIIKPDVASGGKLETFTLTDPENEYRAVQLPELNPALWIPGVSDAEGLWFIVSDQFNDHFRDADGMVGRQWFANRVWTLDYRKGELFLGSTSAEYMVNSGVCPLGFLTDIDGMRIESYPSIQATIDGDTLDFLFDTGATVVLSTHVQQQLGHHEPAIRATCFVTRSVFERWRYRHPEWQVFDHADEIADESIIEVPEVEIGGHTVGPVWFTRRPDTNFHDSMSSGMDKRVEGSLGGSLFRFFKIVVDYPNAVASFHR